MVPSEIQITVDHSDVTGLWRGIARIGNKHVYDTGYLYTNDAKARKAISKVITKMQNDGCIAVNEPTRWCQ